MCELWLEVFSLIDYSFIGAYGGRNDFIFRRPYSSNSILIAIQSFVIYHGTILGHFLFYRTPIGLWCLQQFLKQVMPDHSNQVFHVNT